MNCAPYGDNREEWEEFARRSDDAWFPHTTYCMEYMEEYSQQNLVANRSFAIAENGRTIAICPLLVELSGSDDGYKQFSYGGAPAPFPAMDNELSAPQRQQVLKFYVETLRTMAKQEDVARVWVRIPPLAKSYLEYGAPFANPLIRHGFVDLTYLTQVVDLTKTLDDLWSDVRKGHKSDIKRGSQACEVKFWDSHTLTSEKFHQYQLLHAKNMGAVTRTQLTFDYMYSWVMNEYAVLVEAEYQDQAIGFSLMTLFGAGAYYGSSCKDPDIPDIPASHVIQWDTILWLKDHGYKWYEVGLQQFSPQWFDAASDKQMSIAGFKRGFGGTTVPMVTAEYFYSKKLLRHTFENRLQNYLCSPSTLQE